MDRIEEFVDERHKSWCIHCTRFLAGCENSEDHVPTKSLLNKPRPHNLPHVSICRECNNGFSRDEQYVVTFLSCVVAGSTDPGRQCNASAARALAASPALRSLIDKARTDYLTYGGQTRSVWKPDIARFKRVILKNARGHAFFEYGEPLLDPPTHVWMSPIASLTAEAREAFEVARDLAVWPEVGSRMMTRALTGQDMDDNWVIVQDGVYRYSVQPEGGLQIRSVIFDYLATEVLWQV